MNDDKTKTVINPFIKKRVNSFLVKEKAKIKSSINVGRILAEYQKEKIAKKTATPSSNGSSPSPFDLTNGLNLASNFKTSKKHSIARLTTRYIALFAVSVLVSIASIFYPNYYLSFIGFTLSIIGWCIVFTKYYSKNNLTSVYCAPHSEAPQSNAAANTIRMSLASHYSASTPIEIKDKIDNLINSTLKLNLKQINSEDFRYLKTTFEIDLPELYNHINWDTLNDNDSIKKEMLSVLSCVEEKIRTIILAEEEKVSKNIQVQLNYLKRKSNS